MALADDVHLSNHVSGTTPVNEMVCFGDKLTAAGSSVNISSSKPELILPNPGSLHGTIHVEKMTAEGLLFSAGVEEPVKRSVGKRKKEARLKGVSGIGSSSLMKSKNAKRKIEMELVAGDATKLRRTDGPFSDVAELAEAVAQPHQSQ